MDTQETVFDNRLQAGEQILWTGQPGHSIQLTPKRLKLTVVGLLLCIDCIPQCVRTIEFVRTIELIRTTAPCTKHTNGVSLELSLMEMEAIIFNSCYLLLSLYFLFGHLLYLQIRKKRTFYAVTDRRILILHTLPGKSFREISIKQLKNIPAIVAQIINSVTFRQININQLKNIPHLIRPHKNGNAATLVFHGSQMDDFESSEESNGIIFHDVRDAAVIRNIVRNLLPEKARNRQGRDESIKSS
ncbi:MAG: hypothetical protein ACYC27_13620 [Armatimonadota bacterium]